MAIQLDAEARPKALGSQVAGSARGGLEVARAELVAANPVDVKIDAKRGAQAPRGLLVGVGRSREARS